MKLVIVIGILLTLILPPFAKAQLTKEDVRQIVREENALQEARLKQYFDAENAKLRAELKDEINKNRVEIAKINGKIAGLDGKIAGLDGKIAGLDGKIAALKEGMEFLKWVMGFLAALVIGAIAIPSMVQAWRERKESKRFEQMTGQIEQLAKMIDILKDEVALLKKQRIVKP